MSIIHQITILLAQMAVSITELLGYPGIALLMAMESTAIPLPSELVMPFAGYLAHAGKLNFALALISASLGTLIGSLFSYGIGYYGGEPVIRRLGRYLLLSDTDLDATEDWFKRRGELTIFIGRFVPVVRHLISIPAGIGKMNIWRFSFFTILGGTIWNALLLYAGFLVGANWQSIRKYSEPLSLIIALLLIIGATVFIIKHFKRVKV